MVAVCALCPRACALPPAAGTQAGRPVQVAARAASTKQSGGSCNVEVPVIGGIVGGVCEAAGAAGGAVGGLVSEAASTVGNGILELLAKWMIGAATAITSFVAREMQHTSTPQLQSAWFQAQFAPMADLGAALGLLVALIGLASAAIRRSPEALAATLAGMARAGIGTGLVVALTVIGLSVADQISSAVVGSSPDAFWATVAHAWGSRGFGGFGSSALAMLIALIEVFAAIFVWLELIVRDAAIYVAVLFFPAALAAAIWPALGAWPGRLGRLLMLFVILKPVALIVLSFAGNAAAAGLSFSGGVSGSVGTILAATVIFALAAFAPWALMYLLAADAESAYVAAGVRAAGAGAVADSDGRSIRSAGGLRNLSTAGNGGASGGGSSGGGGSPGGGGGSPSSGGPSANGTGAAGGGAGAEDGTLPVGAESIGAGSIGAAAGMNARGASALTPSSQTAGDGSQSETTPERPETAGPAGETPPPSALVAVPDGPPGDEHAGRPTAAGGASTDASLQRRGSAGTSNPSEQEPTSSGEPPSPGAVATPTLARSPRRRTPPRRTALARESTRPRPALHAVEDGEEE
ncbi:MAG: hypothetical protein ABSG95_12605 [Solirubrobacteraceae bacterium]|jgi:hypothetical protein